MNVLRMMNDALNAPYTDPLLSDMTATADGAGVGQYQLTAKEIQNVESILRAGMVGYAYVYPLGEEPRQTHVLSMTPENMANFIGVHGKNCRKIIMTDRMDLLLLNTIGGFIDRCPEKELLQAVLEHMMPIMFGEVSPKEVTSVTRDIYDLYDDILDEVRTKLTPEELKQAELSARNTKGHFYQAGYDVNTYSYLEATWIAEKGLRSCKLENTPENLAAFIQRQKDVDEISLRDPKGTETIIVREGYVHMCLDETYLKNWLQPALSELRRRGDLPVIQEVNTSMDMSMEM